jgi:PmbA protein
MAVPAQASAPPSPFDQSALTDLAARLVEAARRAGADAADAVAVRSMSLSVEVRDGAVEEAERAESDDVGLRVLVGGRQALVSTNDTRADAAALAERAVAMARVAPEDRYAGLAERAALARDIADLDLIDPELPTAARLESLARTAEETALAVDGVSKSGGASASAGIGGLVLVTSHGFSGAYLASHHNLSMVAIAGAGCTPPISTMPRRSAAAPASVPSAASIRARSRPAGCRSCSIPASPALWSGTSHRRSTARRSCARRAS